MAFNFFRKAGSEKAEMSFVDHLEVLRGHLLGSAPAHFYLHQQEGQGLPP